MIREFLRVSIHGGSVKKALYQRKEKPWGGKLIISLEVNEIMRTMMIGARMKSRIAQEKSLSEIS
jgi:hypothetical protein